RIRGCTCRSSPRAARPTARTAGRTSSWSTEPAAAAPVPPPLTVVQLLPALESGGVERSTLEIAEALVQAGHRAIVVSAGGRLVPRLRHVGAEHVELDIGRKSPLVLRHVPALRRLLRRERADIVHARSRLPAWVGWRALRGMPAGARPRFVTTVHGLNSPSRYSAIMVRGERVICVSRTVRDYVLHHYPDTDAGRIRVVPRGVDPARFPRAPHPDPQARARLAALHPALGGTGPLLLLPGRGPRLKGHAAPIALLAAPRADGPGAPHPDAQARARLAALHPALGGTGPLVLLPGRGTRLKGHADAIALLAALRADGPDARLWMPGVLQAGREGYADELRALARAAG